jgi:hypothetical protein
LKIPDSIRVVSSATMRERMIWAVRKRNSVLREKAQKLDYN